MKPPIIKLFSKSAIFAFTLFVSPLFGALLYADNLNRLGRTKPILSVIMFGLFFSLASGVILRLLLTNAMLILPITFATNALGGYILTQLFWKNHLGDIETYEAKSIIGPLLIVLALSAALLMFVMKRLG